MSDPMTLLHAIRDLGMPGRYTGGGSHSGARGPQYNKHCAYGRGLRGRRARRELPLARDLPGDGEAGVSDPRYKAGIYAGNVLSRAPGDWPDTLPAGRRSGGHPFEMCESCNAKRTFVRFGVVPLCKPCAQERERVALSFARGEGFTSECEGSDEF